MVFCISLELPGCYTIPGSYYLFVFIEKCREKPWVHITIPEMTYKDFNDKIFSFYYGRAKSTFCSLSIDRPELESIINLSDIRFLNELKSPWNYLLNKSDGIPFYFGLLAIQCYAASIMHEDGNNASDAYQVRLIQLLDLEDNNQLQKLFRGLDPENPVQEQIWMDAKRYFKKRFYQHLDIPAITRNAGRYVQYPKSQALLTTEDLKYFTLFFSEEFQVYENISFSYFRNRLELRLENIRITNRTCDLFSDEIKREKCIQQVYDYFNSWQGEIYEIVSKKKYVAKIKSGLHRDIQNKLILIFNNGVPALYLMEGLGSNSPKEITFNEIFSVKDYKVFHAGIFLFTEVEYYFNEYEDSRFLYDYTANYILLNKNIRKSEYQFLEKNNEEKIEVDEQILLYKFNSGGNARITPLRKYFQFERPIRLVGGLRISRGKQYLKGYGPLIVGEIPYFLIHNNNRCTYDREDAEAGVYKIRVDNYRDIEFEIIDGSPILNHYITKGAGWNIQEYRISNIFDIEGCLMNRLPLIPTIGIRDWIEVNLEKKYKGQNILLKAIANSQK